MIDIPWALAGVLIWLVAVAVGLFMVQSISIDCRKIGHEAWRVIRRWYTWRKTRRTRKLLEKVAAYYRHTSSEFMAALEAWYAKKFPPKVECNYALGNCYTCGRMTYRQETYCEEHGDSKPIMRVGLPPAAREMLDRKLLPGPITYVDDRGDNCSVTMAPLPIGLSEVTRLDLEEGARETDEARLRHKLNVLAINPPAVVKEEDNS